MEFCLDGPCVTPKERNLLIRYCISVGTRARCSTRVLLRPLREKDLKAALKEQRERCLARIQRAEKRAQDYDPQTTELSEGLLSYFGGVPTRERFARFCSDTIAEEKETMRTFKRSYSVYVDYGSVGRKLLGFHKSLSPRPTFGYSNVLHEECDFALDEDKRAAFLSSLEDLPWFKGDTRHDWGAVTFGDMALMYEDLAVFRGTECILATVTHEEMMTVFLGEEDLAQIWREKGGKGLVRKLRAL